MPRTKSVEKAFRQSIAKNQHNLFWKRKIKVAVKKVNSLLETATSNTDILNEELSNLQKVLDKAAKNKVIHKNKAIRLKSRYAKRISVQNQKDPSSAKSGGKKSISKSA